MSIRNCKTCDGNGFVFVNCGCREAMCPHTPMFDSTDPRPGIYEKFRVRRTDGTSGAGCKHENCDYFVLDWVHDPFAIPAALAYAAACEAEYPDLALDLRARAKEAKKAMAARRDVEDSGLPQRELPRIVCLCGSTRFYPAFQRANYEETMAGRIVLSVGFYSHSAAQAHGESVGCTPEQKVALDALHFRKIELADEVLVLNVGGYIGESTRNEIAYAQKLGRPVRYLEDSSGSGAAFGASSQGNGTTRAPPVPVAGGATAQAAPEALRDVKLCPTCHGMRTVGTGQMVGGLRVEGQAGGGVHELRLPCPTCAKDSSGSGAADGLRVWRE